jgi:F-type H+-transporting ATPase subunit delta
MSQTAQDPVAARYAQALLTAAKAENHLEEALDDVTAVGGLCRAHPELMAVLRDPGIQSEQKVELLDRVLGGAWSGLVRAFVRMVIARRRAESLPAIAEALAAFMEAERGRLHAVIRSASPVEELVLARLRAALERREGLTVVLTTEVDPSLLGGLQIRLDHRVIDGSVRRQLVELRQRLLHVKVS